MLKEVTYLSCIIEALEEMYGMGHLQEIYDAIEKQGELPAILTNKNWKDNVRKTIQLHCSQTKTYNGAEDLFYPVEGLGKGYWGLVDFNQNKKIELTQEDSKFSEGDILLEKHLRRERNQKLIELSKKRFIKKNGRLYCEVCAFDFGKVYGELGNDFIEAHHIKPVSQMGENEKTNLVDIIMVCSNCHSMIHRKKPWLTIETVKDILKK